MAPLLIFDDLPDIDESGEEKQKKPLGGVLPVETSTTPTEPPKTPPTPPETQKKGTVAQEPLTFEDIPDTKAVPQKVKGQEILNYRMTQDPAIQEQYQSFGIQIKDPQTQALSFDDVPNIGSYEHGAITKPTPFGERMKTQLDRKSRLLYKSLFRDIPFLRHAVPKTEEWEKLKAESGMETLIGVTPFARDVGIWVYGGGAVGALAKAPKIAKAGEVISKIPKAGQMITKMIPEFAKGFILGGVTAESEDPEEIAKKGAGFGTFAAGMIPAMRGISKAVPFLYDKTVHPTIKDWFTKVGKSLGTVLENNKATELIRKRYGEIMEGQLNSEVVIQELDKILTPEEKKFLPFALEKTYTKEAKAFLNSIRKSERYKTLVKPTIKRVREYLDDAHSQLMEYYGEDVGFVENFVPHIWDIPKNKTKQVVSWLVTKNPHLKKRIIPTLREGIEKFGLKLKHENITDILRTYDQYKIKAIANQKFADALNKLKDTTGIKMIQRRDKGPDDWPILDHPSLRRAMGRMVGVGEEAKMLLEKVPVKIHPAIYDSVKAIFSNPISNSAINQLHSINSVAKFMNLSFSLFHHAALSETGVALGLSKEVMGAWNPVKIIKAFKSGKYKTVFNNLELSKDAVKSGLQIGHVMDIEGGNILLASLKEAEKKLLLPPVIKQLAQIGIKSIRKPIEYNNKFLWEYLHSSYKLNAYQKLASEALRSNPNVPAGLVKREVAQMVNDTFGGQVWEILGKSPQWKQFAHFLLLSPDWTLSTFRQALSPFGVGATHPITKGIRQEIGQDFWRKALVYFGGGMNVLNYHLTEAYTGKGRFMKDNAPGKETHLFTGFNPDGTEQYTRWGKQFRELFEFINHPFEVASRKMSPIMRQAKGQFFPHPVWQKEFAEMPFWDAKALMGRAKEIGRGFLPYSVGQQMKTGANILKMAFPVSKGMTPYKTRNLFKSAIKRRDEDEIMKIYEFAYRNNLDGEELFKQAATAIKSDITFDYKRSAYNTIEKIKRLDPEEGQRVWQEIKEKKPILYKQVIKILRRKAKVTKQKKALGI